MFILRKKLKYRLQQPLRYLIGFGVGFALPCFSYAQDFSYIQAEQQVLDHAYSTQAQAALQQAAQLESEALKGLGLPRIDLNARAYAFHSETDVPLNHFKQNLETQLSERVSDRMSELQNAGVPANVIGVVENGMNGIIHDGIGQIPNYAQLNLQDQVFRPTISMNLPLYTGGLTQSAKQVAKINAQRSQLSEKQQQDAQRFELIQNYFNVQLQQQLLYNSQKNLHTLQQHLNNAYKLEQQGFISKGQRMQFEVARNNAERLYQNNQYNLNASQFRLKNLLHTQQLQTLSTPLFIQLQPTLNLQQILASYSEQSALLQKLQMDTALANEKVKVQSAAQKPKVFAFGEYALDSKENWIVGIMASYNLFSGVSKNKQVHAAELQRYATEMIAEQSKQEIANLIYTSYSELSSAQQSYRLLQQNMLAAEENLRIQALSFQEDMGTATQVIDAENIIYTLNSEMALNAYKYVISLATLLHSHGSLSQFKDYAQQPQNILITSATTQGAN